MKKYVFICSLLCILLLALVHFPNKGVECTSCTGVHYLINVDNIDNELVNNNRKLMEICDKCLEYAGVTILKKTVHEFQPQGLTMLYLLSESHFSIHTWPEKNQLRIDLFSCSDPLKCEKATQYLKEQFSTAFVQIEKIVR